ncbi:MAG: ATP-binding protein [Phascolarctobacterium sp.]|nr:ATP-binding protein [Phascolarctobacterium sp.]
MFIGRTNELSFLESKYATAAGELIVLYGRRRVGKTETLRKFCENRANIFFTCMEITNEQLLHSFSKRILNEMPQAAKYIKSFTDWEQAFTALGDLANEQKTVIVIDEFPYMARSNKAIPSIIQKVWDESLHNKNIMLILCGSSMSFMEKEVLAEKNPLYGRATGILKMQEMSFCESVQFFPNYSMLDKITAYAILGGIPHYLKQFDDQLPLATNIKNNILTKGSILYSEVEFLLRQELRETNIYNAIIEAIALGNTKLNDIYQKTQLERSKISVYLKNLIDLGIVEREFPVAASIKERANSQRGLYKLVDNYFRFWYAFVFPNISELEAGEVNAVFNFLIVPELDRYTSYVFENICQQYLRVLNRKSKLPFYATSMGRWWDKTTEIAILATDKEQKNYVLAECKYRNSLVDVKDLKHLESKSKGADVNNYYYFFSKAGFTQEASAYAAEHNITLVLADELFSSN